MNTEVTHHPAFTPEFRMNMPFHVYICAYPVLWLCITPSVDLFCCRYFVRHSGVDFVLNSCVILICLYRKKASVLVFLECLPVQLLHTLCKG